MFDSVDPRQSFPELERGILQYWKEEDTFKRSIAQRRGESRASGKRRKKEENAFSFYDGPPFATGLPHYGHILAGTIKDVIPRYQTMQGKAVERRFGWDCHGLPVEYEIEKEHGISGKPDIEKMGVKAFNDLCRRAVQRYTKEWRTAVERMGRWVDMDWDYRTMDPEYMESIWWVVKALHEKGLLYEGHKPMHICPRCQTPLSNFEVTQGYKDVSDVSLTVKFALKDEPGTFVLAWTTTPWTLPGNLLLAVHPSVKYVKFKREDGQYIASEAFAKSLGIETDPGPAPASAGPTASAVQHIPAGWLIGQRYEPVFPYFAKREPYAEKAFRIVEGDFVTTEEGTGVVHIAPGFGEDDFATGKREGLPLLQHVTIGGLFTKEVKDFAGLPVKPKEDPAQTDRKVAAHLAERGTVFAEQNYRHSYPHCWRCDSPLLNYATSSWFVAVEKVKEQMLLSNAETAWVPAHLRDGRFGKWLEGARDWAVSRNRYWGTPLPVWRCEETGQVEVLASRDDIFVRVKDRFTKLTVLRHGESEGNLIPIYQGEVPGTDLTTRGKKQAKETGTMLKEQNVAVIYCSPLARTQQTAKAVAKATGARIVMDERLREVRFGEFEGKHVDFSDLAFAKARRAHKMQTQQVESIYHFPGMETWAEVHARIENFLAEMLPKHRGEHVVVVTHADPLLNIKHFFTKEDPVKLYHQPYPEFADTETFYWDHAAGAQMDLHKETVDEILWPASDDAGAVQAVFVRHGETDWNRQGLAQGCAIDMPLNATGRAQAAALAESLKGQTFDAVISSDLKRAKETAKILAKALGIPFGGTIPELQEQDLGDWNGKPLAEIRAAEGLAPDAPVTLMTAPPGGETLDRFLARLRTGMAKIIEGWAGKRILVVAHNGSVRGIRMVAEGMLYAEARPHHIQNTATTPITLRPLFRRVPDVLDCWFESGSMPVAQSHFPFDREHVIRKADGEEFPPGFPADFIAEGIDQTRGWFYTLTVLSSVLFKRPAFRNCIVNGTVLAEDGKKMSKRLKNYPEPLAVAEKHGADAVRFMLMSSPAVRGEDLRFSEKGVEETVRSVLLPLWNAYAFFVTYANEAGWEPAETRAHSAHPLDRWIRAEVQDLVNRMTGQLDAYDLSATCAELADSVDALTNWYVRLSRRRFAGKGSLHDDAETAPLAPTDAEGRPEEQDAAFATLYDVLLTMIQLLAPFCPFVTEAMYLNLVRKPHGSIHLTDWPATRKLKKEEAALLAKTRLLRTIVSLGLKVRSEAKVKQRQPLAKAVIAIPPSLHAKPLTEEEIALLREELNVQSIDVTRDPGELGQRVALVDARKVGPRLGSRVQELIAAGKRGDFTVEKDGSVLILDERLAPDEVNVVYRGREGENVASDRGIVVSMDTRLTPDLELLGCGRDLIRAIQRERKDAGLRVGDRITLDIAGADDVLAACGAQIFEETNAVPGKANGPARSATLNGKPVTFRFAKVS